MPDGELLHHALRQSLNLHGRAHVLGYNIKGKKAKPWKHIPVSTLALFLVRNQLPGTADPGISRLSGTPGPFAGPDLPGGIVL